MFGFLSLDALCYFLWFVWTLCVIFCDLSVRSVLYFVICLDALCFVRGLSGLCVIFVGCLDALSFVFCVWTLCVSYFESGRSV